MTSLRISSGEHPTRSRAGTISASHRGEGTMCMVPRPVVGGDVQCDRGRGARQGGRVNSLSVTRRVGEGQLGVGPVWKVGLRAPGPEARREDVVSAVGLRPGGLNPTD